MAQHPSPEAFLIARSTAGEQPMELTAAIENVVRDLGPDVDRTLTYGGVASPTPGSPLKEFANVETQQLSRFH